MHYTIETMHEADWDAVSAIYAEGLATGLAAFMSNPPSWEEWDADHLPHSRLVARGAAGVLGWASLAPVGGN